MQYPELNVQIVASNIQRPTSIDQRPALRVCCPAFSVQSPESSVQSPVLRDQRLECSIQHSRPGFRNSGMPKTFKFSWIWENLEAWLVYARILESLAGCLTELSASDFYWIFISFPLFFYILASLSISRVFWGAFSGWRKSSWLDIPRAIIKCDHINKFHVWRTFLSIYKHFSCQSSCYLSLLEVCENHYRKENISLGGRKQGRDTLLWIHLKETWLNVFILL